MRHQEPELVEAQTTPHHHRDNLRHDVRVPARIEGQAGLVIPATIVDVSRSGMALEIDGPVALEPQQRALDAGARARVRFRRRSVGSRALVTAQVEVIWATHRAIGVRFVRSDDELFTALREIAANAVQARRASQAAQRHELTPRARQALRACRKLLQNSVANLAWVVRSNVVKQLLHEADHRHDGGAQAAAEAKRLEERALSIGLTIEQRFLREFSEVFDLDQTQELTIAQVRDATGGQPDPGQRARDEATARAADNRLLTRVVIEVEERHGARYRVLAQRLARVHGGNQGDVGGPLAPAPACRVIWQALTAQVDSPRVERILEQVMQRHAVGLIGALYDAMAHVLDTHGVG